MSPDHQRRSPRAAAEVPLVPRAAAESAVRLSGLCVYPIKSAAGVAVARWNVDERGLAGDRRWMLVDDAGTFISQRTAARLALVRPEIRGDRLLVSAPEVEVLDMPLRGDRGRPVTVRVWDDQCLAIVAEKRVSSWFSGIVGRSCRAVWLPDDAERNVGARHGTTRLSFADAFPFLLVSEASLADLNRRLAVPVPMDRFRPNLVVSGVGAYEEDGWETVTIGDVCLRVVKPCARCVVTTVDQVTGTRSREPLATLARYRTVNGEILFGQNLVHEGPGALSVGAQVTVGRR